MRVEPITHNTPPPMYIPGIAPIREKQLDAYDIKPLLPPKPEPQTLWDIITISTGNNWVLQQYTTGVLQGDFTPNYRLSLGCKDIGLATEMGKDYKVPLPVASIVEQKLVEAMAAGLGDKHVDAVILRLEELSNAKVRRKE